MELLLPRTVHAKIMHWIDKTDKEVSGFGKISWDAETKSFKVLDVWLLKQEVGAAHTELDEAAIGRLLYQTKDMPGDLRFWWHSHVNMDVFWSGTDTDTITKLGSRGWIVASVFNKRREIRTAFCHATDWKGIKDTKLVDQLPTFILDPEIPQSTVDEWNKSFDECVQERSYTYTGPGATPIGAQGSLLKNYSPDPTDREWQEKFGILGYGIEEEAKALKMSLRTYKKIIKDNILNELVRIEQDLMVLENEGKFKHVYTSGNNYANY